MIGSVIYVMGIQKFRTLIHRRMSLEAAALQNSSYLCFVVNRSRNYCSGMYISYPVVQINFDSCETMIVAPKVRVSSKQESM